MNNSWYATGGKLYPMNADSISKGLVPGVYTIGKSISGFYLDPQESTLTLPEKLYGLERPFIDHVLRTWTNTTTNLGILLNGVQGAGKSITAKQIANEVGLPIILVEQDLGEGMVNFLAEIAQEAVIFCDEYEKVFTGIREDDYNDAQENSTLLTIMDGVRSNGGRKLFLLTTNKDDVHSAMKQRPSRLRYTKEFGNLTRPVIEEIVDDMLLWPELRESTISFIAKLSLITVDMVRSIAEEVNIHRQEPEAFADFFNAKRVKPAYDIFLVEDGKETRLGYSKGLQVSPEELEEGHAIQSGKTSYGRVIEVLEDNHFLCHLTSASRLEPLKDKKAYEDEYILRLEPVLTWHKAYTNAF